MPTAHALVKAASDASVGERVKLYLRERSASGAIVRTVAGSPVTLGGEFVPVTNTLDARSAGNQIEVYIGQSGAVSGDAFYVDAITLGSGDGTPAPARPRPRRPRRRRTWPRRRPSASAPSRLRPARAVTFTDSSTDPTERSRVERMGPRRRRRLRGERIDRQP